MRILRKLRVLFPSLQTRTFLILLGLFYPLCSFSQTNSVPPPTVQELKEIIRKMQKIAKAPANKNIHSEITSLLNKEAILWSHLAVPYWPDQLISDQSSPAVRKKVLEYFSEVKTGPIHSLADLKPFLGEACEAMDQKRKNKYEGHWALVPGDWIRLGEEGYATSNRSEYLQSCKKSASDPKACERAFQWRAQYSLVFQEGWRSVEFGLVRVEGRWVISDIATSEMCGI